MSISKLRTEVSEVLAQHGIELSRLRRQGRVWLVETRGGMGRYEVRLAEGADLYAGVAEQLREFVAAKHGGARD